ncbi:hypothetical protein FY534_07425 [Alicyclobacillus sp. TC]|uniref:Uncharacterized protein n=1 Tax=Alicyclobacillus tolerans TaxID=90970 RepID=A0ABT9M011_9BACL|nr:hypothetical protein [Alicyclobacillus tengchongensis]MDP9729826.1 hypothetical protein [Alicyclobacillus tengchongensis]QRF23516.1 hypothetical protein FY534_07425 [Alicyclobacillus sp. TC]
MSVVDQNGRNGEPKTSRWSTNLTKMVDQNSRNGELKTSEKRDKTVASVRRWRRGGAPNRSGMAWISGWQNSCKESSRKVARK